MKERSIEQTRCKDIDNKLNEIKECIKKIKRIKKFKNVKPIFKWVIISKNEMEKFEK